MGGRQHFPVQRSMLSWSTRTVIIGMALMSLIMLYLISLQSPTVRFQDPLPERSFVRSLETFLKKRAPPFSYSNTNSKRAWTANFTVAAAKRLDEAVWAREQLELKDDPWGPFPLRIYVYDMPFKFTYDLLWLFRNTYHETANLTSNGSPVHRLIEQHSIDYWLWADLIAPERERRLKSVVRVNRQEEADLFYIPFFTTISFFLLEKAQCKQLYREALKWITEQPAWQRSNGRDHILPVHHPWSFKSVRRFMKNAIWLLPDMDSTGNWYKPGEVWLEKDLILPYVPNTNVCDDICLAKSWSRRKTLLFFRGRLKRNAGGKIRSKLVTVLQNSPGVIIEEGSIGEGGKHAEEYGMRSSVFCLSPAGDTPSSARLFDSIVSGCIPVIVSDELELPFEGLLDYRKIALFVSSEDAIQPGWLVGRLRSISQKQIAEMRSNLAKFSKHFQYSSPALPRGPEDLTWRMTRNDDFLRLRISIEGVDVASLVKESHYPFWSTVEEVVKIAGKLSNIKTHIRRSQRVVRGSRSLCICDCKYPNSTQIL